MAWPAPQHQGQGLEGLYFCSFVGWAPVSARVYQLMLVMRAPALRLLRMMAMVVRAGVPTLLSLKVLPPVVVVIARHMSG